MQDLDFSGFVNVSQVKIMHVGIGKQKMLNLLDIKQFISLMQIYALVFQVGLGLGLEDTGLGLEGTGLGLGLEGTGLGLEGTGLGLGPVFTGLGLDGSGLGLGLEVTGCVNITGCVCVCVSVYKTPLTSISRQSLSTLSAAGVSVRQPNSATRPSVCRGWSVRYVCLFVILSTEKRLKD